MNEALITIIIATYNRPDALKVCLNSVVLQIFKDWKIIVIGDNCDDRTEKVVLSINDTRIEYINLPERFGEQSGPNSIGIALADTKYLAFLNHDDIWLQNHLEYGINILENSDCDFFIGGTAYSRYLEYLDNEVVIHVDEINTSSRNIVDFIKLGSTKFEPASSWIINTNKAKQIGFWSYYEEIYRPPIADYILRAWRENSKFYFSKEVTVWAVVTHYRNSVSRAYNYQSIEHELIQHILNSNTFEEIRNSLEAKLLDWNCMPRVNKNNILNEYDKKIPRKNIRYFIQWPIQQLCFNIITAYLYKVTGKDIYSLIAKFKHHEKGFVLYRLIKFRTGDAPLTKPNIENILKQLDTRPSKKKLFNNLR